MIEFQLDTASGVATYLQLVQQVHQALQLGLLEPGDQLPTAQQVVAKLAINPNTVLKAYRDLEREGLVRRPTGPGDLRRRRRSRAPTPPRRPVPGVDDRLAAQGARRRARSRRHRGDLPHRVPQLLRRGCGMTAVLETERARQAVRATLGAARLHPGHPRRQGRRARRPERRGQDHPAASGRRAARADVGHDHGPRRTSRLTARPSSAGSASSPRTRPTYARLSVAKHLRMGAWLNPTWDGELAAAPDRAARPRPAPAGRVALRRPASPARPHPGRSRSGPSSCSSTSRWPAWTRSPGASSCRTSWRSSPSTGSASCSPRISSPTSSGSATTSSCSPPPTCSWPERSPRCWRRTTASPGPAATRAPSRRASGGHRGEPHRQADHAPGAHRRADPRPGLDRQAGHPRRPGPRLHEPGARRRTAPPVPDSEVLR